MAIDRGKLEYWFRSRDESPAVEEMRQCAKRFAIAILDNTPPSADQSAAVRDVREALLWAEEAAATEQVPGRWTAREKDRQ